MSRTMFILAYENGEPKPLDMDLLKEVLKPYVVKADENFQDALIQLADGYQAELDINEVCIGISRFPPGQFFDVLAELVDRLGATVIPMDRPTILRREGDRSSLPPEGRENAVVVRMTGQALETFISGG
ncbi:hypothetical protein ABZ883_21360 [Streptomyces sp. NPDC046977]|uniref:hypothetical protein n=1 Tax=Streptomyces sp. NPDC046977 TaxID=3154703 RepID=UPI0033DC0FD6